MHNVLHLFHPILRALVFLEYMPVCFLCHYALVKYSKYVRTLDKELLFSEVKHAEATIIIIKQISFLIPFTYTRPLLYI